MGFVLSLDLDFDFKRVGLGFVCRFVRLLTLMEESSRID